MAEKTLEALRPTLIFLGAGTGGLLRYWLGGLVQNWWGPTFPLGTLAVNVSGCLAMGFLASAWSGSALREEYRAAVLIGVLGGYTTFSAFGRDTLALLHDAEWMRASVYVLASVLLSLLAVWIGSVAADRLYRTAAGG